ncbi:MAG: helix-turn-helix domain-containing protein [Planctomycetia bacterium]|nr:helix-turn-helix domain-containing protein [Planctomycetia bacterium]
MSGRKPIRPTLTATDTRFLHEIITSPFWPGGTISRARTLLLLAAGERVKDIAVQVGCSLAAVGQRRRRFQRTGILGVVSNPPKTGRPRARKPNQRPPPEANAVANANLVLATPPNAALDADGFCFVPLFC